MEIVLTSPQDYDLKFRGCSVRHTRYGVTATTPLGTAVVSCLIGWDIPPTSNSVDEWRNVCRWVKVVVPKTSADLVVATLEYFTGRPLRQHIYGGRFILEPNHGFRLAITHSIAGFYGEFLPIAQDRVGDKLERLATQTYGHLG
jgi:hypothetical protein